MSGRRLALGVAVVLACLVGGAAAYVIAAMPEPGPARLEIGNGVVGVLAGQAYAYIVRGAEHTVLIDAGSDPSGDAILKELARQGVVSSDVAAVLVTHGHRDHVAAVPLFTNATTYICDADQALLRGDKLPNGLLPRLMGHLSPTHVIAKSVRPLLPGTRLDFGELRFESLLVPGHTQGSCVYLFGDLLFTGDALLVSGSDVAPAPWLFSDSLTSSRRALERLAALPFVRIAAGHGGYAVDGRTRYERWQATLRSR